MFGVDEQQHLGTRWRQVSLTVPFDKTTENVREMRAAQV